VKKKKRSRNGDGPLGSDDYGTLLKKSLTFDSPSTEAEPGKTDRKEEVNDPALHRFGYLEVAAASPV